MVKVHWECKAGAPVLKVFSSVRASTWLQGSLGTLNLNGPCCLTPLLRRLCEAVATRWLVFVVSVRTRCRISEVHSPASRISAKWCFHVLNLSCDGNPTTFTHSFNPSRNLTSHSWVVTLMSFMSHDITNYKGIQAGNNFFIKHCRLRQKSEHNL